MKWRQMFSVYGNASINTIEKEEKTAREKDKWGNNFFEGKYEQGEKKIRCHKDKRVFCSFSALFFQSLS